MGPFDYQCLTHTHMNMQAKKGLQTKIPRKHLFGILRQSAEAYLFTSLSLSHAGPL